MAQVAYKYEEPKEKKCDEVDTICMELKEIRQQLADEMRKLAGSDLWMKRHDHQ